MARDPILDAFGPLVTTHPDLAEFEASHGATFDLLSGWGEAYREGRCTPAQFKAFVRSMQDHPSTRQQGGGDRG